MAKWNGWRIQGSDGKQHLETSSLSWKYETHQMQMGLQN